jgi:hypothetical protein
MIKNSEADTVAPPHQSIKVSLLSVGYSLFLTRMYLPLRYAGLATRYDRLYCDTGFGALVIKTDLCFLVGRSSKEILRRYY